MSDQKIVRKNWKYGDRIEATDIHIRGYEENVNGQKGCTRVIDGNEQLNEGQEYLVDTTYPKFFKRDSGQQIDGVELQHSNTIFPVTCFSTVI